MKNNTTKNNFQRILAFWAGMLCLSTGLRAQVIPTTDTYTWGRMETAGGGTFTGLVFGPTAADGMYIRNDVSHLHRWDVAQGKWIYTGDSFWPAVAPGKVGSRWGFGGSTGVAVHPTNARIVFTMAGDDRNKNESPTQAGMFRSRDAGATWEQVLSVYASGNTFAGEPTNRKHGEPIAIDKNNPSVIYAGTQRNGLYRSLSGGDVNTWTPIVSIPASTSGAAGAVVDVGTRCVVVDPTSGMVSGRSKIVYATVYGQGVYQSTDGGDSFALLPGSPKCPRWMVLGQDTALYVANMLNTSLGGTGGVLKYKNGTWTTITSPAISNQSFASIAVNPFNANELMAANVTNTTQPWAVYTSQDGGATWRTTTQTTNSRQLGDINGSYTTGLGRTLYQNPSAVYFDPYTNATAYMLDAFMVWKTTDLFANPVEWTPMYQGLNNSIPFAMVAPPQSAANDISMLYAGGADYSHYRYEEVGSKPVANFNVLNLNPPIPNVFNNWQYTTGIDFCEAQPNLFWIASSNRGGAVTRVGWAKGGKLDGNTPWNLSDPYPNTNTGGQRISVSATNPMNAVVLGGNKLQPKVTFDGGKNWTFCQGIATRALNESTPYDRDWPLASDRINGKTFYFYHRDNSGEFFRSTDGGATFTKVNTAIPGRSDDTYLAPVRVEAAPYMEGTVWVTLGSNGLWKTNDGGTTFTKDAFFTEVRVASFGLNKPGVSNPTAFVHGRESTGQWGMYRSTDMGATWELITPVDKPLFHPLAITGDRKKFGRVFVESGSTGIIYGDRTSAIAPSVLPAASGSVIAVPKTSQMISVTWQDNATNENLFRIYRKKANETNYAIVGLAGFNQTRYNDDTGIESETVYSYYVESYNEAGVTKSEEITVTSLKWLERTTLTAVAVSPNQINLTWPDSAATENGYRLEYKTENGSWTLLVALPANTTSYQHTGLTAATQYSYQVRAFQTDDVIIAPFSEVVTAYTPYPEANASEPASLVEWDFGTVPPLTTKASYIRQGVSQSLTATSLTPFAVINSTPTYYTVATPTGGVTTVPNNLTMAGINSVVNVVNNNTFSFKLTPERGREIDISKVSFAIRVLSVSGTTTWKPIMVSWGTDGTTYPNTTTVPAGVNGQPHSYRETDFAGNGPRNQRGTIYFQVTVDATTRDATVVPSLFYNLDSVRVLGTVRNVSTPVAKAKDITISLDAQGQAVISAADINDGSTPPDATLTVTPSTFTCANVGSNAVILTVKNRIGEVASDTAIVTVSDAIAPLVKVKNVTLLLNPQGKAQLTVADIDDGSTDACGIKTRVLSKEAFTFSDLGANNVTLTVTDVHGNVAINTALVTIKGTQTITFPALPVRREGEPDFMPGASASSGLAVHYSSSNPEVALVVDNKLRIVGPGTSLITASQPGNSVYSEAEPVVQQLTVTAAVKIWYQDGDNGQLTNNTIKPYLKLVNEGNTPVAYQELTLRYWFTAEDFSPINGWIDYAQVGSNNVSIRYVRLEQPRSGAFGYLEYRFNTSAGNLAPQSNSGPIESRIAKQNWTNFNEADDYSYAASVGYAASEKVTLYRNGKLIGGQEPLVADSLLKLKVQTENKNSSPATSSIRTFLTIYNEGNVPVEYKDLQVRYWFTSEGSQTLNHWVDYAQIGNNFVKGRFVKLPASSPRADTYFEVRIDSVAGTLHPLSNSGIIQYRLAKNDWSAFDETNDYSWQAAAPIADNVRVTVYWKGTLIYGTEPASESGSRVAFSQPDGALAATVYPNPGGEQVTVEVQNVSSQKVTLQLTNSTGQVVGTQQVHSKASPLLIPLNLSTHAPGLYLLRVSAAGGSTTLKIIKH